MWRIVLTGVSLQLNVTCCVSHHTHNSEADSFSFECRGCTRMKELEVELEQLRLIVVAMVGREQVGCASGSGGGQ